MLSEKQIKNCTGCHACYNICPKNAIQMVKNSEGFLYPIIDKKKCIECNLCNKICPLFKNTKNKVDKLPETYACYNKNDEIIKESSSGGMFYLLAEEILSKNGVVFGAGYDEEYNVKHMKIERIEELPKLMGSKYVQSIIESTYKETKELLEDGRYVLYTGTPCQIEGLVGYLRKSYDKLYLQDIICHGVPSPEIWEKYKKNLEKKYGSKIKEISFRSKNISWANFSLYAKFENGEEYIFDKNNDLYLKTFLNDIALRESCYDCKFKKVNRLSDITLADFWGISKIDSDIANNKGTSLLLIHTEKGKKLFEDIKNKIEYQKEEFNTAISVNRNMIYSADKLKKERTKFFTNLQEKNDIEKVLRESTVERSFAEKNVKKLKEIYRKISIIIKYKKRKI